MISVMKKKNLYIIFLIYILLVLLFFLDAFTQFDIKDQGIKIIVWVNALLGSIIISILILLFIKSKKIKMMIYYKIIYDNKRYTE